MGHRSALFPGGPGRVPGLGAGGDTGGLWLRAGPGGQGARLPSVSSAVRGGRWCVAEYIVSEEIS